MEKVLILPHSLAMTKMGFFLWRHLVWGDPQNGIYGRHSYAAKLFLEFVLQGLHPYVYLGNGSFVSKQDENEPTFHFKFILENLQMITGFDDDVTDLFKKRCFLEPTGGQNTRDEVVAALNFCKENDIGRLVTVTSPFHAPRSWRDALAMKAALNVSVRICPEASDTEPLDCNVSDVVIKEPSVQ